MPDMLVKLYELPPLAPALARQAADGIAVRRALAPDRRRVIAWVDAHYGAGWAGECAVAFARLPVSCFLAVDSRADGDTIAGFACYDAVARNFFGPTGVAEAYGGRGIGTALLLACLHAQAADGYAYAIIGGVGPAPFYSKAVGATLIPGSDPGIYAGLLRSP